MQVISILFFSLLVQWILLKLCKSTYCIYTHICIYIQPMRYLYFLISIEINSIKKYKSHVTHEFNYEVSNYDYLEILMNKSHLVKKTHIIIIII